MLLDFDDFEKACLILMIFQHACWILMILKKMLDFDDFEEDASTFFKMIKMGHAAGF